jgi:pimeloyl-ACP methyl ester carboxylesterase
MDNWIRLEDGRRLGYGSCGDPSGMPIFYCHGFPGSRLEVVLADRAAAAHSIRLIGIDRPGYGLSDAKPGRRLTDWAEDVTQLADHLHVGRFSVLGVSGGGPYAAACAFRLPTRVAAVGMACGLAPVATARDLHGMTALNRLGLLMAVKAPSLIPVVLAPVAILLRRRPALAVAMINARASAADRQVLHRRDVRRLMAATFREAMRSGFRGAAGDLKIYGAGWGFALDAIRVPVVLWHGEKDRIVPAAMGRRLAAAIPGCQAAFYPTHGHFSLILEEMPAMLDRIAALQRP